MTHTPHCPPATTRVIPFLSRSMILVALMGLSGRAIGGAQPESTPETEQAVEQIAESRGPGVILTLDLGAGLIGEADFDTPVGTIESTSFDAKLGVVIPVDDRARLILGFGAGVTDYDITPAAGAVGTTAATVGTQFDTVTEFGVDALYSRAIDADTSFFVGGGIGVAREGGASDALVWNGLGGFMFTLNENLKLGIGVGVFSQLEDDVRIVPLPQIELTIDERWSLKSQGPGVRLNYDWSDTLDMGISAGFSGQSFRIDNDNTLVPNGSVSISGVPLSYYLEYSGGDRSRVSFFAEVGVILAGQMEIFNSSGATVVDEDIDPGVFVSGGIRFRF